ncbi:unnamed protein product [Psylliodes chrysocephalus]|uniref:Uncharacterized protein n=1 Tax=Psylliodes chrysocephalus TaxID=3402493 RepID=A0A9P0G8P3_9CUCU|nr:unnamed protein product [Psylliodes chrysocephala]
MDFSTKYGCKYAAEVQSAHFGLTRLQISLHTVVFYYRCPFINSVKHVSCCSLSKNLRYDPAAICANLIPIFKLLKEKVMNLRKVQCLSNGPKNQYKNKKMVYLISNFVAKILIMSSLSWHLSESGHGKCAPDRIGSVVKRTADKIVALGQDVEFIIGTPISKGKTYANPEPADLCISQNTDEDRDDSIADSGL